MNYDKHKKDYHDYSKEQTVFNVLLNRPKTRSILRVDIPASSPSGAKLKAKQEFQGWEVKSVI